MNKGIIGAAYGVRKDCRNLLMTTLSPRTPIPNLLLTGQSLMLHGVEGVTMPAIRPRPRRRSRL